MQGNQKYLNILNVASTNFILKGYRQTQVTDIAKELSISTGAIYNLFAGKKAVFDFTLRCIFDDDYLTGEITLPIEEIDNADMAEMLQGKFDRVLEMARQWTLSFEELLSNSYDLLSKYGTGFLIFEHNTVNWPKLSQLYYQYRKNYIGIVEKYLHIYIADAKVREIKNVELHTRLIIETLAWWGMHRKFDRTHWHIEDAVSKEVVIDALVHAYKI